MRKHNWGSWVAGVAAALGLSSAAPVSAQAPAPAAQPTLCGTPIPPPANLPPTNMGPVVYFYGPCFDKQGGVSVIEPQTYLYYIQLQPSQPSQNIWRAYDQNAEQTVLDDFKRLWATNFLDDLSIEVEDYRFT